MSFELPTLKKIMQRTKDSFRAHMPGTDVEAYPNNIAVLAKVIGGAVWELYNFLNDIKKQMFVATATWGLDYHVKERAISDRKPNETNEQLRTRIQQIDRRVPQGGNEGDYEKWALDCEGVTRAFVLKWGLGKGSVVVWPMMDNLYDNGIPSVEDCALIKAQMEIVAPLLGDLYVLAASPKIIDITINDLSPDTALAQNEILEELIAYFKANNAVSTIEAPLTIYLSNLNEIISGATYEEHHSLSLPNANIVIESGKIPILGDVNFE